MPKHRPPIHWRHPAPRGAMDRLVGPGATPAELAIQFIPALLAAVGLPSIALIKGWDWSMLQCVVAGLLVLDLVGGVITNATSAAKRWFHREGQGFDAHMGFVMAHLAQPVIVMLFFDRWNWSFVLGAYGYVVISATIILKTPLYLQRPIASLLTVSGIAMAPYVLPLPPHFEWFLPLYFMKLLLSHLLREEPYRPEQLNPALTAELTAEP